MVFNWLAQREFTLHSTVSLKFLDSPSNIFIYIILCELLSSLQKWNNVLNKLLFKRNAQSHFHSAFSRNLHLYKWHYWISHCMLPPTIDPKACRIRLMHPEVLQKRKRSWCYQWNVKNWLVSIESVVQYKPTINTMAGINKISTWSPY